MQAEAGATLCKHVLEYLLPWACSEGTGRLRGSAFGPILVLIQKHAAPGSLTQQKLLVSDLETESPLVS